MLVRVSLVFVVLRRLPSLLLTDGDDAEERHLPRTNPRDERVSWVALNKNTVAHVICAF